MLEKDVVYYELEVGVRILDDDENWIDVTSRYREALTDCASSVSISHIRSE
jgi:hypothetical protein